jgi:hypothetical protein
MQAESACKLSGRHHYFVPEVVAVPSEGKVFVLAICTECNDFKAHEAIVARPGSTIRLLKEEKTKEN